MSEACIPRETALQALRKLAKQRELGNIDEELRVDIWNVSDDAVAQMMTDFILDPLNTKGFNTKKLSATIRNKLTNALNVSQRDRGIISTFLNKLKNSHDPTGTLDENKAMRHQAIALQEVIESIRGEIDKANRDGVELDKISPDILPNLPLNRVAASIGRKIAYLEGFGFQKTKHALAEPKHVEYSYYQVGLIALQNLEGNDILRLSEKGEDVGTLKDYMNHIDDKPQYKAEVTTDQPAIILDPKALGLGPRVKGEPDEGYRFFTERSVSLSELTGHPIAAIAKGLKAINIVSTPTKIVFPGVGKPPIKTVKPDVYERGDLLDSAIEELESKPVQLNQEIHDFFQVLHNELRNTGETASQWIKKNTMDAGKLASLFGVETERLVEALDTSISGANVSRQTPVDDAVEYFNRMKGEKPAPLFFAMFAGRNARHYNDASVFDAQQSKLMRYALGVKEYAVEVGSPEWQFYTNKVAIALKIAPEAILEAKPRTAEAKRLDNAITALNEFNEAKDGLGKLTALTRMETHFPGMDFASLLSTVKAAQLIRDNTGSKSFKTTYAVSSDATASGGVLSLLQSLGVNPEAVQQLLKDLGIFGGTPKETQLKDIYEILQKRLDLFIEAKSQKGVQDQSDTPQIRRSRGIVRQLREHLFKGEIRELAKPATMTFIYDQSKTGAVNTLAKDFTERLMKKLNTGIVEKATIDLINDVLDPEVRYENTKADIAKLRSNKKLQANLREGFVDTGAPESMFDMLEAAITAPYLGTYKRKGKQIFDMIKNLKGINDLRVYPAAIVIEYARTGKKLPYTKEHLDQFGIPMTKIFEVGNSVEGTTVLNREEQLRETVMNVSFVHGIDNAAMYLGLHGLLKRHDTGAITVHDDFRSAPKAVIDFEEQYKEVVFEASKHFDIHEQVLLSAAAYAESLNGIEEYTTLKTQAQQARAKKAEILEKERDGYLETLSVIGDKQPYTGITVPSATRTPTKAPAANENTAQATEQETAPAENASAGETVDFEANTVFYYDKGKRIDVVSAENLPEDLSRLTTIPKKDIKQQAAVDEAEALSLLEGIASDSEIVRGFLKLKNRAKITVTDGAVKSTFDPQTDTVKLPKSASIEQVEHEITHSYTTALITEWIGGKRRGRLSEDSSTADKQLTYIDKSFKRLKKMYSDGDLQKELGKLDDATRDKALRRFEYALSQPTEARQMAEFISIMNAEPDAAVPIYKALDKKGRLAKAIEQFINRVARAVRAVSFRQAVSKEVDGKALFNAISVIAREGKSQRETHFDEVQQLQSFVKDKFGYENPNGGFTISNGIANINASVARYVNEPGIRQAMKLSGSVSSYLAETFPAYTRAIARMKGVYDDSVMLPQLVEKITNASTNAELKNFFQTAWANLRAEKNETISTELQRFDPLIAKMTETEKKDFYDFTHKLPLGAYLREAETIIDIPAELKALEQDLSKHDRGRLDTIVDMNVDDVVTQETAYNVKEAGFASPGDRQNLAKKYVALKSIERLGYDRFDKFRQNKELMVVLKDNILANEALMEKLGRQNVQLKDTNINDQFKDNRILRAISLEDVNNGVIQKKKGWTVVKPPTKTELGVAYLNTIDQTYQDGIGVETDLQPGDLWVAEKYKNFPNVVKVGDEYRYITDSETKRKAGLITDASQGIVRTMGHNYLIEGTNGIREKVLEETTYWDMNVKGTEKLVNIIKDKTRDHPWFLSDLKETAYDSLPKKIRDKYMPVADTGKTLSNMGGFSEKIQYVRKDISYWLVGSRDKSLAENRQAQWAIRITKDLVAGAKINMIINNPIKIGADNVANISYLSVMGVEPLFVQRQYRTISKEWHDYHELKKQINKYRVRAYADPKKYGKKIDQLKKQLEKSPANGFVQRGFVNSLGSDLVMRTSDPGSGFKSDVDTVLKTIFEKKGGKRNALGDRLMEFSKWNVGMEEILETFSPIFKKLDSTKVLGDEMDRIAERFKHIKNEDDLISYMHQYMNSPDSEFVKLGTNMTDLTDVLAKETLYRHLTQKLGWDPKKAELEVIDVFPDYKEGLPPAIKQLSDVGILMFPSYWLRIQKTIYRMVRDKPVSFGTELAIENYFNIDAPQIWDQNIVKKANGHWGLFHNPWSHIGVGSIFPTRVLG